MPVYIGVGFYTSSDFLYKQTESLGFAYNFALIKKSEITEYLKSKFSLKSLYIATNFNTDPNVVIFEKIINTADPYCTLNLGVDITPSKEFENLRDFAAPGQSIDLIVYDAYGRINRD